MDIPIYIHTYVCAYMRIYTTVKSFLYILPEKCCAYINMCVYGYVYICVCVYLIARRIYKKRPTVVASG